MKVTTVIVLLLLQCNRFLTIRVPVDWTRDSEVNKSEQVVNTDRNEQSTQKTIYKDYFQYTAQKPQFAVDVAAAHGVESPESLFKTHPVRPYTNLAGPELGHHHILDPKRAEFQPYQKYVQSSETGSFITPASTSFEVFHPYKAEEPYLQQIYRDPVLGKIRNDLRDSKNRLQSYETEAGRPNVRNSEYLEGPNDIDRKKIPQRNVPTNFEIHRPHRRPVYDRPPISYNHREHFLNNKLKSPWKTNVAKITPAHYRPLKHHLHGLRQQHAMKFDDEHNEYPQVPQPEKFAEQPEGYDIYENGKVKYNEIKNNAEELINNNVKHNRLVHPQPELYIRDESSYANNNDDNKNDDDNEDDDDDNDDEEFVPIKNYAQVRKTESTKHLPKQAAFEDAESLEEIKNAPRLREAIKSTKAQTVYSEEGYEDGAYDHGGEEKHASDHEGHGGYLKEHEISGGKYKAPSINESHEDENAAAYRDEIIDKKEWEDSKKHTGDEEDSDDYSENEEEQSVDNYTDNKDENSENYRHKRNEETKFSKTKNVIEKNDDPGKSKHEKVQNKNDSNFLNHDVIKREIIPNILKSVKSQVVLPLIENENITFKYPYYYKNMKTLNKNSPIRYAENIKLIPKKTRGGTEFYDSRSYFQCPEVENHVDPIPEKIKKGGHPDNNEESDTYETYVENKNKEKNEKKQRLSGLGDKIDCFKLKYFGENPLDSPFFKEDKIEDPEPIRLQNITDIFYVLDKLHGKNKNSLNLKQSVQVQPNTTILLPILALTQSLPKPVTFGQKDIDPHLVSNNRKKRASPFVYEPYKIIKDSQIHDSKKTTTSGNISPLIKQLQSSRIVDKVSSVQDKSIGDNNNSNLKLYKDISKEDRQKHSTDQSDSSPKFIDVSSNERRVEPRFEIKPTNHKTSYSPVESKRVMSVKDYESRTKSGSKDSSALSTHIRPVDRNYFDVSQYLPQNKESQNIAASTAVRQVIRTTTLAPSSKNIKAKPYNHEDNEEYDEYEDEDEDDEEEPNTSEKIASTTSTTTTTSQKPVLRKRTRGTTTPKTEVDTQLPKLKLVTRFNSPKFHDPVKATETYKNTDEYGEHNPKYTEMKKKTRARTLVTDTRVYGDEGEDTRKEEVDELIGVKQDMDDYLPLYEKAKKKSEYDKNNGRPDHDNTEIDTNEDDTNVDSDKHNNEDDSGEKDHEDISEEDDYDDEDEDDVDDDDDDEFKNEGEDENKNKENKDDLKRRYENDEKNSEKVTHKSEQKPRFRLRITTSEPTKRTLLRTTVSPITTTAAHRDEINVKPVLLKKIEIHKEIPVNNSSPNITQFKQDIKEIEIVRKNTPKTNRKLNKNLEALDLYRDDNLAKDINSLGGVDIFKENLYLDSAPRHGGNYRSIDEVIQETTVQPVKPTEDVETSESEPRKTLKLDHKPSRSRSRQTLNNEPNYSKEDKMRSSKIVELIDSDDSSSLPMHGGNIRLSQNNNARRHNKNSKYVELEDDDETEEIDPEMHGGNFKVFGSRHQTSRGRGLHGGNYRSAKIIDSDKIPGNPQGRNLKKDTSKAAELLDKYARAVPILTTTPVYILDPSKRMYYYVDA